MLDIDTFEFSLNWKPDSQDSRDYTIIDGFQKIAGETLNVDLNEIYFATTKIGSYPSEQKCQIITLQEIQYSENTKKKILSENNILIPLNLQASKSSSLQPKENIDFKLEPLDVYEIDRNLFSPIETQGSISSCTAHAGVALLEYFERRAAIGTLREGKHTDLSRLFLYKAAQEIEHTYARQREKVQEKVSQKATPTLKRVPAGTSARATVAAMVLIGVLPEEYFPYEAEFSDIDPSYFHYAIAQNSRAESYIRLDRPNIKKETLLQQIKVFIKAGFPPLFGFKVYESMDRAKQSGRIPFPAPSEKEVGGHAVVAVGYNDSIEIDNFWEDFDNQTSETEDVSAPYLKRTENKIITIGAFKIRNCWGEDWGDKGYAWLPYAYLLAGKTDDWWSLLKTRWLNTRYFGFWKNGNVFESCNSTEGCPHKP